MVGPLVLAPHGLALGHGPSVEAGHEEGNGSGVEMVGVCVCGECFVWRKWYFGWQGRGIGSWAYYSLSALICIVALSPLRIYPVWDVCKMI